MSKPLALPGGELESAVMSALLSMRTATTREIHERVGKPAGLAYTTVATVLDRLHQKGLLARERQGRSFTYRLAVNRETFERARAKDIIGRFFEQEPHPALAALVTAVESVDPKLLDELLRQVQVRRKSRRGS